MKILLVEGNCLLGAALRDGLRQLGYVVDWIQSGSRFDAALSAFEYDCVVLDLSLPDADGESLLKRMRAAHDDRPAIVITARQRMRDCVDLLDIGADDCLIKPIDPHELAARLRAVTRRADARRPLAIELEHGPLKLCRRSRSVTWHDQFVALTRKEFGVLEALLRRKNSVLSRAQIVDVLYGFDDKIGSNAVDVYIHRLRRKFGPDLIFTVRGVGYRLGTVR